jgi:phosphohistidine phosphatase
MQLLVIRHGIADDRDEFAKTGEDDSRRPLTKRGERKMRDGAAGLVRLIDRLDVIGASPLVRAQQTAAIVADAYGDTPVHTVEALAPEGKPTALVRWLAQQRAAEAIAIVGHEPDLGELVTWLMTGHEESRIALRKGGACLLEFSARPAAGGAVLQWALTPAQLRRSGR